MGNRASRPCWLEETCSSIFGCEEICLPQDEENKRDRLDRIEKARHRYQWRFDGVDSASMISGLPLPEEMPRLGWIEGLLHILYNAVRNRRAAAREQEQICLRGDDRAAMRELTNAAKGMMSAVATCSLREEDVQRALEAAVMASGKVKPLEGDVDCFDAYRKLYKCLEPDVVVEEDQFLTDEIFGWYRVAGANCMRLTKCTDHSVLFPELNDVHFQGIKCFENDTLAKAADDDRLYSVTYPEFDEMEDTKEGRYVYAPRALFAVPLVCTPRKALLPIAIYAKPGLPMYTPCSDRFAWIAAKNCVQVADALTQSVVYHLARTHLVIEVFNCATRRALADNHPLYKLLMPHFYGTALMNWAATKTLVVDGYDVDKMASPAMSALRKLAARSINSPKMFNFNKWMPDIELEMRGVTSEKLHFPYRDDTLSVWDAVFRWADSYVRAYYKCDADVLADSELQAWCKEVSEPRAGNLPGFGDSGTGVLRSVDVLSRTIAMVIFTASAAHAATNFPQGTVMQFAPAMPLGGYAPAITQPKPYSSMQELVKSVMPPLQAAERQMFVAEVLGTFRFTRLGQYGKCLSFAGPDVQRALRRFVVDLDEIAVKVGGRNKEEREAKLPPYNYLHPENIPQSINI